MRHIFVIAFALAACGTKNDAEKTLSTNPTDFDGFRNEKCTNYTEHSDLTKQEIKNGKLEVSVEFFNDLGCRTTSGITLFRTHSLALKPSGSQDYGFLDATLESVVVKLKSAEVAAILNEEKYCGFSDWVAEPARDVVNSSCLNKQGWKGGETKYYLYRTVDNTLEIGADTKEIPTVEANRPKSFGVVSVFRK